MTIYRGVKSPSVVEQNDINYSINQLEMFSEIEVQSSSVADNHAHEKYTFAVIENTSFVDLPVGKYFNISSSSGNGSVNKDGIRVYLNGVLQTNGLNFIEVKDLFDESKGVGVSFAPEILIPGDFVVLDWVDNSV